MSSIAKPPGQNERPGASSTASGPNLFTKATEGKDNAPGKAPQDLPPEIDEFVGQPDYDWNDTQKVLIPEQPPIAVYENRDGTLTIRQRQWPEDDTIITVNFDCIAILIEGLSRFLPERR